MTGNGAANANAVIRPTQGSCLYPDALHHGLLSFGRCSHECLHSRGTQPWRTDREEVKYTLCLFERAWCLYLSWVVKKLSSLAGAKPNTGLCFPISEKADHPALQCGEGELLGLWWLRLSVLWKRWHFLRPLEKSKVTVCKLNVYFINFCRQT